MIVIGATVLTAGDSEVVVAPKDCAALLEPNVAVVMVYVLLRAVRAV